MPSVKLAEFYGDLESPVGVKHLVKIGDSINDPFYSYKAIGTQEYPIKFKGMLISGTQSNGMGASSPQTPGTITTNAPVSPLGATYGGSFAQTNLTTANNWPFMIREVTWSSNPVNMMECACNSINFSTTAYGFGAMPGRDTWLFQSGDQVTARFMFLADPRNLGSFVVVGKRGTGGTGSGTGDITYNKSATDGSLITIDVPCSTSTGIASTNRPYTFVKGSSGYGSGTADTIGFCGCWFMNDEANGVLISWVAFASWTTGDHAWEDSYSVEKLAEAYVASGVLPTHLEIELNENINSGVRAGQAELLGSGSYVEIVANLELVVQKHDAAISLAASIMDLPFVPPRVLFCSTHKTSTKTLLFRTTLQAGLTFLAHSNPRYSFKDVYEIAGGENFNTAHYTGDGIHLNIEGARYVCRCEAQAIRESLGFYAAPKGSVVLGFGF